MSRKVIYIVSYALKMGVTRVFVVFFRSQSTFDLGCRYVSYDPLVYQQNVSLADVFLLIGHIASVVM